MKAFGRIQMLTYEDAQMLTGAVNLRHSGRSRSANHAARRRRQASVAVAQHRFILMRSEGVVAR